MSIHAITETVPSVNNFEGYEENLAGIPEEIWRIIFAQTSLKTQVALSRTAKQFYVITKPIIRETIIAQHAFGKAQWERFFGDVGVEPPLPVDIATILYSPCPFWFGKRVHETHLLTLVPKTVNGQPFTLDCLDKLIQHPKQGIATKYNNYNEDLKLEYGGLPVQASHWVLMTNDVIPDSRDIAYDDQQQLVASVGNGYAVPTLLVAATNILMAYFVTGKMLYRQEPRENAFAYYTYTRCQEGVNELQSMTGAFSPYGLDIYCTPCIGHESHGVAAVRTFL